MNLKKNSSTFIFVFLGMLTAFAPFVTDMYLPGLPIMAQEFNTSVSMVQMGLTCSMLGLAFGQLVFGPLSDRIGRRKPLIVSMWLFVFSTLACIFAPTIQIFVALCFMMGLSFTVATAAAMDAARANAGTASAILGAGGFLFGSIVSPLSGLGNLMVSASICLLIGALGAAYFARLALKN